MSLATLGLKGLLASDKAMTFSFIGIFTTTIGYGVLILAHGNGPQEKKPTLAYSLVAVDPDMAVIQSPEGLQNVRVGSILPGLGTITAIGPKGERLAVSTSSGQTLTVKQPRVTAKAPSSAH